MSTPEPATLNEPHSVDNARRGSRVAFRNTTHFVPSDGFSSSVELVGAPILFILTGIGLDRRFHTGWVFAVALGTFAILGVIAKQYYVYNARMATQEAALRSNRAESDHLAAAQRDEHDAKLLAEQADLAEYLQANRPADAGTLVLGPRVLGRLVVGSDAGTDVGAQG